MPRDWADAEYSRIYHTVVDDPKFADVFYDDRRWAAYTRLLMVAESAYPSPATLPRWLEDDVLEHLVSSRIIALVGRHSYRIVGMRAEREGRLQGHQIGGMMRARNAERDEFGRFRGGSSDDEAPGPSKRQQTPANGQRPTSSERQQSSVAEPSLDQAKPRDSSLGTEENRSSRGSATDRADIAALRELGWKRVTKAQRRVLDEIADRHRNGRGDGSAFAAEAIRNAGKTDPLKAAIEADQLWQDAQRRRVEREELDWKATKERERREAAERLPELERWT